MICYNEIHEDFYRIILHNEEHLNEKSYNRPRHDRPAASVQVTAVFKPDVFNQQMRVFSLIIGGATGLLAGFLLWASAGHPLLALFYGVLVMEVIIMGIYGWLPLIFGGTRILD